MYVLRIYCFDDIRLTQSVCLAARLHSCDRRFQYASYTITEESHPIFIIEAGGMAKTRIGIYRDVREKRDVLVTDSFMASGPPMQINLPAPGIGICLLIISSVALPVEYRHPLGGVPVNV